MSRNAKDVDRLVLGTAQLGLDYGIANKSGKPDTKKAKKIIETALQLGIREFDTAQVYGESEKLLGITLKELGAIGDVRITTKVYIDDGRELNQFNLKKKVKDSIDRLGCEQIHCLMLHKEDEVKLFCPKLSSTIQHLKEEGLIKKFGVSLYTKDLALKVLEMGVFDCIQVPGSILDRRFLENEFMETTNEQKKDVYIRSIFLQGLLLLHENEIPSKLSGIKEYLKLIEEMCVETGLTVEQIAILYIRDAFPASKTIFGAETTEQIKKNIAIWTSELPAVNFDKYISLLTDIPEYYLNPSLW